MTTAPHPSPAAAHAGAPQAPPGSLLDGLGVPDAPPAPAPAHRFPHPRPPAWLRRAWSNRPLRYGVLAALVIGASVGAWLALRPVPEPDYALDPMDDVLNFTLLTDEFNKLPIDERLKLLAELVQRIKTMSSDDSALMAAFAASINTDRLRAQLEQNASGLVLDLWDKFALDYQKQPEAAQGAYLDDVFLSMVKTMEAVAGVTSTKTDEERLKEAGEQARRDEQNLQSGRGPTAGQLARMADMMRNRLGSHASPQQQQRGMQLMRDMTRHLRGQDPETGKKKP